MGSEALKQEQLKRCDELARKIEDSKIQQVQADVKCLNMYGNKCTGWKDTVRLALTAALFARIVLSVVSAPFWLPQVQNIGPETTTTTH